MSPPQHDMEREESTPLLEHPDPVPGVREGGWWPQGRC